MGRVDIFYGLGTGEALLFNNIANNFIGVNSSCASRFYILSFLYSL